MARTKSTKQQAEDDPIASGKYFDFMLEFMDKETERLELEIKRVSGKKSRTPYAQGLGLTREMLRGVREGMIELLRMLGSFPTRLRKDVHDFGYLAWLLSQGYMGAINQSSSWLVERGMKSYSGDKYRRRGKAEWDSLRIRKMKELFRELSDSPTKPKSYKACLELTARQFNRWTSENPSERGKPIKWEALRKHCPNPDKPHPKKSRNSA